MKLKKYHKRKNPENILIGLCIEQWDLGIPEEIIWEQMSEK